MEDNEYKNLEKKLIPKNTLLIEKTLESFGLIVKVSEINIEKEYTEYCLEITMGTNLEELEKHSRDIALAVASPTGKVEMIIPIPGRALVGVRIPKFSKEYLLSIKDVEKKGFKYSRTWRDLFAFIFVIISYLSGKIASFIININTKKKN